MAVLNTTYLGLVLSNPLIVSSSGLTNSTDKIIKLEEAGAGAVVLKSLFEEQIRYEAGGMIDQSSYPEAQDYIMNYVKDNSLKDYLKLIESAKKAVNIPVMASINCISASEWVSFARDIEQAGADALELNVFFIPTDENRNAEKYEALYYELIEKVKNKTSLPLSIKIGPYFTSMLNLIKNIYYRGAKGAVLFNRFFSPDINVDSMKFESSEVFSSPADIRQSLRWVGIVSGIVEKIDIVASTGIHDGKAAIKQLLAGAKAVQVCSVLYKNGVQSLTSMIKFIEDWMTKNNFKTIDDFRGKMSYRQIDDPVVYERSQFMKYFSSYQ